MKWLEGMRFPDWVLVFAISFTLTTVLAPIVRGVSIAHYWPW